MEYHEKPQDAFRAWLILFAHEKRNGRSGEDLIIRGPSQGYSTVTVYLEDVHPPLPDWVVEVLGEEYLSKFRRQK